MTLVVKVVEPVVVRNVEEPLTPVETRGEVTVVWEFEGTRGVPLTPKIVVTPLTVDVTESLVITET